MSDNRQPSADNRERTPFPVRPGYSQGFYPEREAAQNHRFERLLQRIFCNNLSMKRLTSVKGRQDFIDRVNSYSKDIQSLNDEGIDRWTKNLRRQLATEKLSDETVAKAFAMIRSVAAKTVGMSHYDTQIIGGWVIINGVIAEMETGEGKTLTATLPAATAALAGIPVHVITVNDYLAERDAGLMKPVYNALGLTVGVIQESHDAIQRKAAYRCDITYCSNKQIAFDYLKDRLILGGQNSRKKLNLERLIEGRSNIDRLLLRGLVYAIVDEADSVMVDEARTPLILSVPGENEQKIEDYRKAFKIAEKLKSPSDFYLIENERRVVLSERGSQRLTTLAQPLEGIWASRIYREELVNNALKARHLFKKDSSYIVKDENIRIVDEFTGRTMPDRSWNNGLHQMIQMKEGCEVEAEKETIARTCYQRFFKGYLKLSGMTGTATEIKKELKTVYDLNVVKLHTRKPVNRDICPDKVFFSEQKKWAAVVRRIEQALKLNRPVLVGTRSVAASEHLHRLLKNQGIAHQTLNAKQDKQEAQVIAKAGESRTVTVATNMAGRGTDIKLTPASINHGGLLVIATERHEARRIDRQLFGRCARQGEPGSVECLLSIEDELIIQYCPRLLRWIFADPRLSMATLPGWLANAVFYMAQKKAESTNARTRNSLLKMDKRLESLLAFSGKLDY